MAMGTEWSGGETVALIFITGFAIQQVLTMLDLFVNGWIQKRKGSQTPPNSLPGGMNDADFKKTVMAFLAFVLGLLTVWGGGIGLLSFLVEDLDAFGKAADIIVSALVVGSGTEAANTVLKFLGYVKDAQKPGPAAEVTIVPAAATVKQGAAFQFNGSVKNAASDAVDWTVVQSAAGTIDSTGLFVAGATPGVYQVKAASKSDRTKFALAAVTVT